MRSGGGDALPPLPLAGEGRGGGPSTGTVCKIADQRERLLAERAPTRRFAPTSPASGRGKKARDLPRRVQPPQNFVELFEVAVADVHGATAVAVIDADGKPERIADAFLERDRVGVFHLATARLLRL